VNQNERVRQLIQQRMQHASQSFCFTGFAEAREFLTIWRQKSEFMMSNIKRV